MWGWGNMEKRKRIGVLLGGVSDDFTKVLCSGLRKAAKQYDVNLVILPGKFLDRDYTDMPDIIYEYQYSTLFSYATKDNLDGIIVAANCIGCCTTKQRMVEFMRQYEGIPTVLVSSQMDGYVSVNFDNYKGIRDGLDYLIEVLHCRKIGIVSGPKEVSDSVERKNTFDETLRAHGIEPDPKCCVYGGLDGSRSKQYAKLLDDNPDIEAVFCVNDEVAAGFYEELKRRNRMPGKDISVFGYDDNVWCSQIFPTLSSVRADASVLGIEALKLLIRMMNGESVDSVRLPTQFIRRNSFCKPATVLEEDKEDVMEQYMTMNHWLDEQRDKQNRVSFEMKQFIMKILRFERGNDQSYGEILGTMDWLGITNAFLFIYNNPLIHLNHEQFQLPEEVYMKAVQRKDKVRSIPAVKQRVNTSSIFDLAKLGVRDQVMMVLLPLYSNEILYGILMCDLSEGVLENGEFLSGQLSAAVKMINLLKTNENVLKQLEESLVILQENNLKLDTLSKSDPLTGICNRRGFFQEAEPLLEKCRKKHKSVVIMYVDMNNLKIINDRYGHDEGDFSLKTIANILVDIVGNQGIVARIGGDEYACAVVTEEDNQSLLQRIYEAFNEFNKNSDKTFKVTVSAGAYRLTGDDTHTLEEAMIFADEQLYEVKKLRKKDVAKEN